MTTDQWLAGFESKLAELRQKSEDLQEGVAAAESTVSSRDGSVTVTVGPSGGLKDLRLGHRAVELGAAKLTALILETTRTAQRQAAAKVHEAFLPLGEGTESMRMYMDAVPDDDTDTTSESEEDIPAVSADSTEPPASTETDDDEEDGRPW